MVGNEPRVLHGSGPIHSYKGSYWHFAEFSSRSNSGGEAWRKVAKFVLSRVALLVRVLGGLVKSAPPTGAIVLGVCFYVMVDRVNRQARFKI